jgi:hypothetical protein
MSISLYVSCQIIVIRKHHWRKSISSFLQRPDTLSCGRSEEVESHPESGLLPEGCAKTPGSSSFFSVILAVCARGFEVRAAAGTYPHGSVLCRFGATLDRASRRMYLLTCARTSRLSVWCNPSLLTNKKRLGEDARWCTGLSPSLSS